MKQLNALLEQFEDVERITIKSGTVKVQYHDSHEDVPATLSVRLALQQCPFLQEAFTGKSTIVIVRDKAAEHDHD